MRRRSPGRLHARPDFLALVVVGEQSCRKFSRSIAAMIQERTAEGA
ncbi:MAG: hypothetical protein ACRDQ4_10710 [Pseudonocardiaceae bacterium]